MSDSGPKPGEVPHRLSVPLLLILIAVASVPVWGAIYPPLVDYPMHVARAFLLSLPHPGQGIGEFYQAKWQPIPNLGVDIVASTLMRFVPPLVSGKIALNLILAGLVSGGFALSVAIHKRVTIAAFLPCIALFDQWFYMGFANYLLGIGLALWAMAVWIWSETWPVSRRAIWLTAIALLLLVCHLLSLGITVLGVLCFVMHRKLGPVKAARLVGIGAFSFLVLLDIALLLLHKTPIDWQTRLNAWKFALSPDLKSLLFHVSPILVWLILSRKINSLSVSLMVALLTAVLVGPSFAGGTAFASERLTLPLMIVLLASLEFENNPKFLAWNWLVFAGSFLGLATTNLALFRATSSKIESVINELQAIPEKSTLATVQIGKSSEASWAQWETHVADWLLIVKPVFVAQNFSKPRQQPMVFQPIFEGWHQAQNNNPIECGSYAELVDKAKTFGRLQVGLNQKLAESGQAPRPLYLLLFHSASPLLHSEEEIEAAGFERKGVGSGFTLYKLP